jgi:hypothetical protein
MQGFLKMYGITNIHTIEADSVWCNCKQGTQNLRFINVTDVNSLKMTRQGSKHIGIVIF